ncbi:MAG: FRG domain-containing protein [Treponematales bacterium]
MAITSISEFLEKCFCNPLVKKENTTLFYRGMNQEFPRATRHQPSLYYPPGFYQKEHLIVQETVSIFPDEMLAQKTTVEKLILMKHYCYPTRVLDISKNPLIGLFFSCFADKGQEETMKWNGIVSVYAVPTDQIYFCDSDTVTILANLCKLTNEEERIDSNLSDKAFNEQPTIKRLLHEIRQDKPDFASHIDPGETESVVCLRPRMNSPRIIRQDGYFFLFGFKDRKETCSKLPQDWILDPISIPSEAKQTILEQLDAMDINEGFVYPDFEHVNNVIKKHYGNK